MIVGDNRKFLSALITLKVNIDLKNNKPSHELSQECRNLMTKHVKNGENIKTVEDAINSPDVHKYI